MPELVIGGVTVVSGKGTEADERLRTHWTVFTSPVDTLVRNDFTNAKPIDSALLSEWGLNSIIDVGLTLPFSTLDSTVDVSISTVVKDLSAVDVVVNLNQLKDFSNVDVSLDSTYINVLNFIDVTDSVDYGILTPVDSGEPDLPWRRPEQVQSTQILRWGYSLNDFLIGGSTDTNYPVDPEAVNPPIEPIADPKVVRIVNIINIVKLPERTPIGFSDLTLSFDLDSVAWVANFNISTLTDLALIRPTAAGVVEVEITINSEVFIVFVGRTNTTTGVNDAGAVVRRIRCTGWSRAKALTYPYSARKSRTENSSSTPAGILSTELTGTGFTGTWSSPTWTIPANVFGYVDKAPLAAISQLVSAIGGVVIPHPNAKSFEIKPYYPISPWNWTAVNADRTIHENQFFSIDTDWIPAESPDSIYVYGEEHGVAVKAVRQGTPGSVTLPTVVDKHITDTIAGTERGRIEIAKNGFKEIVPVTTYLEPTGIIMPQTLLNVTTADGASTWLGMVISTSIGIVRNGNAVTQTLQIERHY